MSNFVLKLIPCLWAFSLTALPVFADQPDQFTMVQSAKPLIRDFPGLQIDVLGIAPGMDVQTASKILAAKYGSQPNITQGPLGIQYKGLTIQSQAYDTVLNAENSDASNQIAVYLGTPTTGNTVVDVSLKITYSNPLTAPTVESILSELQKKYGGTPVTSFFSPNNIQNDWVYDDKGVVTCQKDFCEGGDTGYSPGNGSLYATSVNSGDDVVVTTTLYVFGTNQDRVQSFAIELADEGNKLLTTTEAAKQLQAYAEKAFAKQATPQSAPNF